MSSTLLYYLLTRKPTYVDKYTSLLYYGSYKRSQCFRTSFPYQAGCWVYDTDWGYGCVVCNQTFYSSPLPSSYKFDAELILYGKNIGNIIKIPDDDIAVGKWQVLTNPDYGTAPDCIADHNDDTYCQWTVPIYKYVDILMLDLGEQMSGIIRYVYSDYLDLIFYTSNDGVTWNRVAEWPAMNSPTEYFQVIIDSRYIKFTLYNGISDPFTFTIRSLEFYPYSINDGSKLVRRKFRSGDRVIVNLLEGDYALYQVIYL